MATTRDQIIATTCELLERQGYHATGMNQIIRESNSPKGSLYYHFPGGKEELALAAVNRAGQLVLARIRENLASVSEPAESIRQFVEKIAHHVETSGYRAGGPITTIAMETAATNEPLRHACDQIYQSWQAAFAQKLMEGGMQLVQAQQTATMIISAIEGGIILARTAESRKPLEYVAGELAQYIEIMLEKKG